MILGGLQKTTLVDFPGKVACTVFTVGCNFRCPFCHNRDLALGNIDLLQKLEEREFFEFLKKRKKVLDGVCISGGELTLQKDIFVFCKKIKDMGLSLKLDTNGSKPEIVKKLIEEKMVDYVAIDFKTEWNNYSDLAGVEVEVERVQETMRYVMGSGLEYCIRTTHIPTMHSDVVLERMANWLLSASKGGSGLVWVLQKFRPNACLDPEYEKIKPWSDEKMKKMVKRLRKKFSFVRFS